MLSPLPERSHYPVLPSLTLLKAAVVMYMLLLQPLLSNAQEDFFEPDVEERLMDYRDRVLSQNEFIYNFQLGAKIDLGWRRNGTIRLFAIFGFLQNFSSGTFKVLLGGQSELEMYRGGLGTSLQNREKSRINLEWRNSLMMLGGWEDGGGMVNGKPAFVSVGDTRSALVDPLDISFSLGTTFINGINHRRNQQIGTLHITVYNGVLQYYNDATPFHWLGLADRYDRYWTGGGQLGAYWKNDHTLVTHFVLRFDNYTGYQVNLYEVAGVLQIDNMPYYEAEEQMYNQANFQYKVGIKNNLSLNLSEFDPRWTDVQNLIHYYGGYPFHARPLDTRWTIGADYMREITLK